MKEQIKTSVGQENPQDKQVTELTSQIEKLRKEKNKNKSKKSRVELQEQISILEAEKRKQEKTESLKSEILNSYPEESPNTAVQTKEESIDIPATPKKPWSLKKLLLRIIKPTKVDTKEPISADEVLNIEESTQTNNEVSGIENVSENIEGDLDLRGLTSAEGLKMAENIVPPEETKTDTVPQEKENIVENSSPTETNEGNLSLEKEPVEQNKEAEKEETNIETNLQTTEEVAPILSAEKNEITQAEEPNTSKKIEDLVVKIENDEKDAEEHKNKEEEFFEKDGIDGAENFLEQGWKEKEKQTQEASDKLIDKIFEYDEKNTRGKETSSGENKTETTNINPEDQPRMDLDEKKLVAFVENKNKDFFGQMSDIGKEIMSNAYEGIYMTPGLNRLVGKMEIAYNQFWINKKEGKASKLKDRMDAFGLKNRSLDAGISEINNAAKMLEEFGMGGSASLLVKSKKLENSISKNKNEIDKLQGGIEERGNRVKLFTDERDAVANRLIAHYEKKLSPIEGRLEVLEEIRNGIELSCIASEVRLDEQRAKIKKMEDVKKEIEKRLLREDINISDRQIRKNDVIKELETQIKIGNNYISKEQEEINKKRENINKKIAKINKKAEPYRNRKNEFIRIKDNRPIDFKLEKRKYADEFRGTESTESHPRESGEYVYNTESREESARTYTESNFENMERFTDLIEKYNNLVRKNGNEKIKIDEKELSRATRLSSSNQMSIKNFKRILEQYYKAKKIKVEEYKNIINNFK